MARGRGRSLGGRRLRGRLPERRPRCRPVGFLAEGRCCFWDVDKNWSFFPLMEGLSLVTAFLLASSCKSFDALLMACLRTSGGKSLSPVEIVEFLKSMKDSNDIESFTFTRTTSLLFRMMLTHRVEATLATRCWHLARPTTHDKQDGRHRWTFRAKDRMAKVQHSMSYNERGASKTC